LNRVGPSDTGDAGAAQNFGSLGVGEPGVVPQLTKEPHVRGKEKAGRGPPGGGAVFHKKNPKPLVVRPRSRPTDFKEELFWDTLQRIGDSACKD